MGEFIKTQNSFASGQVDSEFFARDDINGLSQLENMDVIAGGGLTRRRGLVSVADLRSTARLIPFSVSEEEDYLLALTDGHILVYSDGVLIRDLLAPWNSAAHARLQYAQRFGTMIFVHPDYEPRILKKTENSFSLTWFSFSRNDADMTVNIPFMKFDDADDIKITVTQNAAGNNYATFTTSAPFWSDRHVNGRLLLLGRQWVITKYVSPTVVTAYTNGPYTLPSSAISDWAEAVFSNTRGWPCSISFHQDRLVFGGSRDWPAGVWMSQVGRHNNFNVGTGLDDEAIFITLLSQRRQEICTVVSSDNLQILTSVGEWAISSKPLTPSVVDIKQHTSVGSIASRYLPPQKVEGATVFISATKKDIRELALDELGENYNANDLCALSKSIMTDPVDISYNGDTHQLFVVMASGDMAVLNKNSALGISAWGVYKTRGLFKSVAAVGGETYVVTQRDSSYFLEKFSDSAMVDAGRYEFSFTASALPLRAGGHNPKKIRIRKISARVLDTKSLFINGARVSLPNSVYEDGAPGYDGDVTINVLGTRGDTISPMWTLHGTEPFRATVLSVTIHGWYAI